jgi:hypothetical protein
MTSALPPQYPTACLRESLGALVACQRPCRGIDWATLGRPWSAKERDLKGHSSLGMADCKIRGVFVAPGPHLSGMEGSKIKTGEVGQGGGPF